MTEQPDLFGLSHSCKGDDRTICEKHRKKLERPFREKARYLKGRAKKLGIPFGLSEEYLRSIWTGVCPVFETELRQPFDRSGKPHPDPRCKHQPSLDRIIPAKGYVPGNVIWISMMANTIKATATANEVLAVGYWLKGVEYDVRDSSD